MRAVAVIVVTAGDYYWSLDAVRDMFGPLLTQDDMMLASLPHSMYTEGTCTQVASTQTRSPINRYMINT